MNDSIDWMTAGDEAVSLLKEDLTIKTVNLLGGVSHSVRNTGATTNRWLYGYKK
ncbi:MAG: hypothetical protein QF613_03515 [Candidatus Marinimicrobia bacterium]|jgi:hypothetical protein|nr:hypothetical protein [Candidatus Neomarinimicrobiota bacterium]MDP6593263.1 hypothetical protein [Candidatus Neomarinimicrobiota bacterium]MDP6836057.1 hypothetical protein [Candidatus Neomarinimicrobiota bacterium]|tara:strand:- start:367 stop:528 length:162 start_codon:yes stop_codon:yes gene_type:complete